MGSCQERAPKCKGRLSWRKHIRRSWGGWGRPKAQPEEHTSRKPGKQMGEGRVWVWWAKQRGTIVPKPKEFFCRKDYRLKLASKLFGVLKSLHSGVPLRDLEAQLPFLEIMDSGGYFCHLIYLSEKNILSTQSTVQEVLAGSSRVSRVDPLPAASQVPSQGAVPQTSSSETLCSHLRTCLIWILLFCRHRRNMKIIF